MLHIDGYLCEVKDVQIRDGLHVLGGAAGRRGPGQPGAGVLRASQVWGGRRALPGLRAALAAWAGLDEQALLAEPGRRDPSARAHVALSERADVADAGGSGSSRSPAGRP